MLHRVGSQLTEPADHLDRPLRLSTRVHGIRSDGHPTIIGTPPKGGDRLLLGQAQKKADTGSMSERSASRLTRTVFGSLAIAALLTSATACSVPAEHITGTVTGKDTGTNYIYAEGGQIPNGKTYWLTVRTCDSGPDCDYTRRVGAATYTDADIGEQITLTN